MSLNGTASVVDADVVVHADQSGARTRAALVLPVRKRAHQRLLDRAVITAVEHQHALRGR